MGIAETGFLNFLSEVEDCLLILLSDLLSILKKAMVSISCPAWLESSSAVDAISSLALAFC
jgi:hypothetical protein